MSSRVTVLVLSIAMALIAVLALTGVAWGAALLAVASAALTFRLISQANEKRRRSVRARRAARATGRHHAREELDDARHLRAVIDRVDAPILVAAPATQVVLANASCATLLGRTVDNIVGRPLGDLVTQSALIECCEAALAGQISRARVTISILGRQRTFDASAIPLQTEAGTQAVLTLRDVTDLATAHRLKADFVANASHELRTPVTAIMGSVETLEDASDDPPTRDRLIAIISRNARRLEDLLNDLLELGRLEAEHAPPPAEALDVCELLADIASAYEARCEQRSLNIEIDVQGAAETVVLNKRLVEVVLSNLIDNATRFANEGTTCTVRARRIEALDDASESVGRPGIRFEVVDRGPGIPLNDQTRIFERFYQVDHSRTRGDIGGTGLGLSIVKHAVQILGGRVGVESILHQGSTFSVEIPDAIDQDPPEPGSTSD